MAVEALSKEDEGYITDQVACGRFRDRSDVLRAALQALREKTDDHAAWMDQQVKDAADAYRADPSGGQTSEEVRAALFAHFTAVEASGR
ncbi:MAG: type II toxin-antitoxin system ParD family antitoxin [Pseudomonadota bacterium]